MEKDFQEAEKNCGDWGVGRFSEFIGQFTHHDDPNFRCTSCGSLTEKITDKVKKGMQVFEKLEEFSSTVVKVTKTVTECGSCSGKLINFLGEAFKNDKKVKDEVGPSWSNISTEFGGCNGRCDCKESGGCTRVEQMKKGVQNIGDKTCEHLSTTEVQSINENALANTKDEQDDIMWDKYNPAQQQMVANKRAAAKRAPSSAHGVSALMGFGTLALLALN